YRERRGAGSARNAGTDDRDVDAPRVAVFRERRTFVVEPVRAHVSSMLTRPHHRPVASLRLGYEPCELELSECGRKQARLEAGQARELVSADCTVSEALEHLCCGCTYRRRAWPLGGREPEQLEHVLGRCQRRRGLPNQPG